MFRGVAEGNQSVIFGPRGVIFVGRHGHLDALHGEEGNNGKNGPNETGLQVGTGATKDELD